MRPLLLVVIPLLASACMAAPPTSSATISIEPGATLASRSYVGGLCADGPCSSSFVVRGDGTWVATDTDVIVDRGSVPTAILNDLATATATTALLSAPEFTGTCPTAFDGVEVTYAWTSPEGVTHELSACDRAVPPDDPLVVALDAAEEAWAR
jgi:hypothetical protein